MSHNRKIGTQLNPSPIAAAVALAMLGLAMPAYADDANASSNPNVQKTTDKPTSEIIVTGIRASKQAALNVKKNADVIEEVVSADDIGKMPDKNVADAVSHLPGVEIQNGASGTGGAFDEADRVSIRSTSPSLTSTTVNGHAVSSGDWFVLDQTGIVGRSVSYSLLPSELVSRVVVHKDQEASDLEGGAIGNVDIQTRKPLEFSKQFTAEASLGAVHSTLADKTDPQFNALFNWKNLDGTMGFMVQGFSEERHLRRDGVEELTYNQISATNPIAVANPQLAGVYFPEVVSSALFTQQRKRQGGVLDFEIKPSADVTLDLNGFYSHMDANNLNAGYMVNLGTNASTGGLITVGHLPTSYGVTDGVLTSASFAAGGPGNGAYDETYARVAYATSEYIDLDGKFRLTDNTTLKAQAGYTEGKGVTTAQNMFAGQFDNAGASYSLNGLGSPTSSVTINPSNFSGIAFNWIWGASPSISDDKESYGQIDAETQLDNPFFTELKYGARTSQHERKLTWIGQGPKCSDGSAFAPAPSAYLCANPSTSPDYPANFPSAGVGIYPSNFGSGFGSGFINNAYLLSPAALAAYDGQFANRNPVTRYDWQGSYDIKEDDTAAYVEAKMQGVGWSGNAGLRLVSTDEKIATPTPGAATQPGIIIGSAFGPYYIRNIDHTYIDILPSVNFKIDLGKNLDLRLSASRAMSRPDYGALANPVSVNSDTTLTATGGNPNLKPITSNNLDAEVEWYFAPRSYVSLGLFADDLTSYVGQGVSQQVLVNQTVSARLPAGQYAYSTYNTVSPTNTSGKVYGLELGYEQALSHGFGINANFTYADAQETSSHCVVSGIVGTDSSPCDLIGSSRITYNLGGYYEDDHFNGHLTYSYRSSFFNGLTTFGGPSYQDGIGTLAASLGYKINDNLAVNLDLLNLNDPISKYYAYNKSMPLAIYDNGRQYYLSLNLKY